MPRIDQPVPSPCVRVCQLDHRDMCVGCGRLRREIGEWSTATPARQAEIRVLSASRLEQSEQSGAKNGF